MELLDALRGHLGDRLLPQPGWSTRTRPGTFRPVAVMWHWTAAFSTPGRPAPSTGIVTHGLNRPDLGYFLPGPLYHLLVGYDGLVRLIHRGVGNHAGRGSWPDLAAASRGEIAHDHRPGPDTGGMSSRCWGIALDYHPDQGPVPPLMLDGLIRATAGIHDFMGWDDPRIVRGADHREITRRKIDNQGVDDIRAAVHELRAAAPEQEDDHMIPFDTPHPDARGVRKLVNHFFTVTGTGEPSHVGWLPDRDVIDDQAARAITEALQRLIQPVRWGGYVPVDLVAEEVGYDWIREHGVGLAITTALGVGISLGVTAGAGRR